MPATCNLSDPSDPCKQKFISGLKILHMWQLWLVFRVLSATAHRMQHLSMCLQEVAEVRIICLWGHVSTIFVFRLSGLTCTPLTGLNRVLAVWPHHMLTENTFAITDPFTLVLQSRPTVNYECECVADQIQMCLLQLQIMGFEWNKCFK